MYIKDGKRFNPHATIVHNGVTYAGTILRFPYIVEELGITEVAEPSPPEDYSEDTYYRTESDDAPYVIYTPKDPAEIAARNIEKKKGEIRGKEQAVMDSYMKVNRQFMIQVFESLAAGQGITPTQLYAANKGYRGMVDLEASIAPIRAEINDLEDQL